MPNKYTMIFDDDLTNIIYNGDAETLFEALKIVLEYHKTGERPHGHKAGMAQYIANNLINNEERIKAEQRREYKTEKQREYRSQNAPVVDNVDTCGQCGQCGHIQDNNNNKDKDKDNNYNTTPLNPPSQEEVVVVGESENISKEVAKMFFEYASKKGWDKFTDWKAYFLKWANNSKNTHKPSYDIDAYERESIDKLSSFDADEFFQEALFKGFNEGEQPK